MIFAAPVLLSMLAASGATTDQIDALAAKAKETRRNCGPIAVWYCLKRSGQQVTLEEVSSRAEREDNGVRLSQLLELTRSFGVPAKAVSGSATSLEELPVPSILVIRHKHCVVYEGLDETKVHARIFDPASGQTVNASLQALRSEWSGEAVLLREPSLPWTSFLWLALLCAVSVFGLGMLSVTAVSWLRGRQEKAQMTRAPVANPAQ
jgi:hypothetical protein